MVQIGLTIGVLAISSNISSAAPRQTTDEFEWFGEMVALLWARGQAAATVRLEHLWQQFCKEHAFSVFCAYPKAGFTKHPQTHSRRFVQRIRGFYPSPPHSSTHESLRSE
jgi:hypothetical protein